MRLGIDERVVGDGGIRSRKLVLELRQVLGDGISG